MQPTSRFDLDVETDVPGDHDELILQLREFLARQPEVQQAEPVQVKLPVDAQVRTGLIEIVTLGVTLVGTIMQAVTIIQAWLAQKVDRAVKSVKLNIDGEEVKIFRVLTDAEAARIEELMRKHRKP
jgi:hypothetical protein